MVYSRPTAPCWAYNQNSKSAIMTSVTKQRLPNGVAHKLSKIGHASLNSNGMFCWEHTIYNSYLGATKSAKDLDPEDFNSLLVIQFRK